MGCAWFQELRTDNQRPKPRTRARLPSAHAIVRLELARATAGSGVVYVTLWYPDEAHRHA
jgi:hypothetical protein